MVKKTHDFFFEHYEKNTIPEIYQNIVYYQNNEVITNSNFISPSTKPKVYSILFIPGYIKPKVVDREYHLKKIKQFFKGYAIFLNDFKTVDEYIKFRFRRNSKSILKRLKRLEHSFPITYKFYYGSISDQTYNNYMESLKSMIVKRFKQRNDISQNLRNWKHYQNIFFKLINNKKASLFVINNGEEPICISLGNHCNGKLFSSVSSYNIDFAKFSLGSIEIYKKLEWCLKNNHDTYELGMGDLSYKQEWCNYIYNFEHQIIYPKNSFQAFFNATAIYTKFLIKESIYKLVYTKYKKFKQKFKKTIGPDYVFKTMPIEDAVNTHEFTKLDYNSDKYSFLKKAIYDFLYLKQEHVYDIMVFKSTNQDNTFYITGKNNQQKIIVNQYPRQP